MARFWKWLKSWFVRHDEPIRIAEPAVYYVKNGEGDPTLRIVAPGYEDEFDASSPISPMNMMRYEYPILPFPEFDGTMDCFDALGNDQPE